MKPIKTIFYQMKANFTELPTELILQDQLKEEKKFKKESIDMNILFKRLKEGKRLGEHLKYFVKQWVFLDKIVSILMTKKAIRDKKIAKEIQIMIVNEFLIDTI